MLMLGHDDPNVGGNGDVPNCGGATVAKISAWLREPNFFRRIEKVGACQAFLLLRQQDGSEEVQGRLGSRMWVSKTSPCPYPQDGVRRDRGAQSHV